MADPWKVVNEQPADDPWKVVDQQPVKQKPGIVQSALQDFENGAAGLLHGANAGAASLEEQAPLALAAVAGLGDRIRNLMTGSPDDTRAADFVFRHLVDPLERIKQEMQPGPDAGLHERIGFGIGNVAPAAAAVALTGGADAPAMAPSAGEIFRTILPRIAAAESYAVPATVGQAATEAHQGVNPQEIAGHASQSLPENLAFMMLPAFRGKILGRVLKGVASNLGLAGLFDAATGHKPTPEELATQATLGGLAGVAHAPEAEAPAQVGTEPLTGTGGTPSASDTARAGDAIRAALSHVINVTPEGEAIRPGQAAPEKAPAAASQHPGHPRPATPTEPKALPAPREEPVRVSPEGQAILPGDEAAYRAQRAASRHPSYPRPGEAPPAQEPGAEPQTSASPKVLNPHQLRVQEYNRKAQEHGLNPSQIQAFTPQDVRDAVNGFFRAEDRVPTVERVQRHLADHGGQAHYVEADIANLKGLNEKLGHTEANKIYRGLSEILHDALNRTGAQVIPFRHGGDEISAVVVGADPQAMDSALQDARERSKKFIKDKGLDKVPRPRGDKGGTGLYAASTDITPGEPPEKIFSRADRAVEAFKKGKHHVNRSEIAPTGDQPGSAGRGDQGPAGSTEPQGQGPRASDHGGEQPGRAAPAVEYFDPRLKQGIYRHHLQALADELTPGGGIALVGGKFSPLNDNRSVDKETPVRRLPSVNPQWFQETASLEGITVKQTRTAVEKALAGERLGDRQQRVVRHMLDEITARHADPEDVDIARRRLKQARQLREIAKKGGRAAAVTPPIESYSAFDEMPGHALTEDRYDPRMGGVARELTDLSAEAGQYDPDGTEATLEGNALGKLSNAEAARRYWDIIERGRQDHAEKESQGQNAATRGEEPAGVARAGEVPREPGQAAHVPRAAAGRQSVAPGETQDLIGGKTATEQALHDERIQRDRARNSGQQSVETGDSTDLFSQARQQVDIEDHGNGSEIREPSPDAEPGHASGRGEGGVQGQLDLLVPQGAPAPDPADYGVLAKNVEVGRLPTGITEVHSAADVGHVVASLRKIPQENAWVLVTDKDGKVLQVMRHTIGTVDGAGVYPGLIAGAVHNVPGASDAWFVHQHPSGISVPSQPDRRIFAVLSDLFNGSRIHLHDGVIVSGRGTEPDITVFNSAPMTDTVQIPAYPRRKSVPLTEVRKVRNKKLDETAVSEPRSAKEIISKVARGRNGVAFLDTRHRVIAFMPIDPSDMGRLRGRRLGDVLESVGKSVPSAAIIHLNPDVDEETARQAGNNLAGALSRADVRVLDILVGHTSLAERGLLDVGKNFKSVGEGGATGRTVEDLRGELARTGGQTFRRLEDAGILRIVQSPEELPDADAKSQIEGVSAGMWDGRHVWLVADRIRPGKAIGVFLHEVGEHAGMQDMLGDRYPDLVRQFKRLLDEGNVEAARAVARVPKGTPEEDVDKERLAYLIQDVAERDAQSPGSVSGKAAQLVRRIIAAIRAWFYSTPFYRMLEKREISMKLSPSDIAALARRAAGRFADHATEEPGAEPRGERQTAPAYSRTGPEGEPLESDRRPRQDRMDLRSKQDREGHVPYEELARRARVTPQDAVAKSARNLRDGWREWFPDKNQPVQSQAMAVIAREIARSERAEAQFDVASNARRKVLSKLSNAEQLAFIDSIEHERKPAKFPEVGQAYRKMLDQWHAEETQAGLSVEYREGYFPHYFHDPAAVKRWVAKMFMKGGRGAFQKQRTFETIRQAIEAGFKPLSLNPEDLIRMRFVDHERIMMRHRALQQLERYGFIHPGEGKVPGESQFTTPDFGTYSVPDGVATLLNNSLFSDSLWNDRSPAGSAFRGWMELKQIVAPMKLAFSAFHLLHVFFGVKTASGMAESMNAIVDKPVNEDSARRFAASLARHFIGAGDTGPVRLNNVRLAWEGKKTDLTDEEATALRYMLDGGFSFKNPVEYRTNAVRNFRNALDDRSIGKASLHLLPTMMRGLQYPIMDVAVPAMKLQAYLDGAARIMLEHPELVGDDLARMERLAKLRDNIDKRFGELAYNRLFWNKRFSEAMQAAFLSFSWNYGFVHQFGGGMLDLARGTARVFSRQKAARMNDSRLAYSMMYIAQTAVLGGLITYLFTHKEPKTVKDLIYPVVGYDHEGKPERVNTMFFTREFGALWYHYKAEGPKGLWNMLLYKGNPVIGVLAEQLQNKNFYDRQISDPLAPMSDQVKQRAQAAFESAVESISLGSISESGQNDPKHVTLSLLGFNPAPGYVSKPPLVNRIYELYGEFNGGVIPYAEAQQVLARRQLRALHRQGKEKEFESLFEKYSQEYRWSKRSRDSLMRSLNEPAGAYEFSQLPPAYQLDVFEHDMTDEQRNEFRRYMNHKALSRYYAEQKQAASK